MKATAVIGMAITGIDCVETAMGAESQHIFSPNFVWLWWLPAVYWLVCAFAMCFTTVLSPGGDKI